MATFAGSTSSKFFCDFAISCILLSVSLESILTLNSSNFIFCKLLISIVGNSVTEIIYSKSLSSPKVFKSILGCPAGFILFSCKALVLVSFNILSKTSPNIAFPNCLFKISFGTFPVIKHFKLSVF